VALNVKLAASKPADVGDSQQIFLPGGESEFKRCARVIEQNGVGRRKITYTGGAALVDIQSKVVHITDR
jgi:hypothetical protein